MKELISHLLIDVVNTVDIFILVPIRNKNCIRKNNTALPKTIQ